ncbi:hypothetical protein IQ270_11375 [Microcoleus sp. LEGE 07076]|uniref:hypothetical protein n=1 Tax=Microcoleus sp. LEGE 07076 TaxID=915322 RepID=UPI00187EE7F5|nr:hypothetical protein [Microcoleus sp. LEGE 07076]MBE9185295.1 hypothetical protein [Microcoleus sp. LEGE 07076]
MLPEKCLKLWTVVRSLPNVEKVVVGQFRRGASHFGNQYKYSDNCLAKLIA